MVLAVLPITPILGCSSGVSSLGLVNFAKLRSKLPMFDKCGAHFSVGKIIYWVDTFGQWTG